MMNLKLTGPSCICVLFADLMALLIYYIIVPVPFCCFCKKYFLNNAKVMRHQEISPSQCNLSTAVICSLMPGLNQLGRRLLSGDFFQSIGAWCLLKDFMNGKKMGRESNHTTYTLRMAVPSFLLVYLILGEVQKEKSFIPSLLSQLHHHHLWNGFMAWYPVTTAIGKLSFDGPECIKEIQIKTEETKSISQFFSKKDIRAKPPIKSEPVEATEQESVKYEPENRSTFENKRMKAEPVQNGLQKSVKEEPESQLTLDKHTTKAEPVQNSQQKSVKEEPQSQSTPQNSRMEGEQEGNSHKKNVKEEHDESQDDYHQTTTKKDDGNNTSDISTLSPKGATASTEKRDYAEFSAHAKPSAKETERRHTTPVRKKSKGADDKQPTLFSYFGRS
ncbi:UNVERIFIED_CONTAM: hypothetical protein Sradi_0376800 [Sesamum radiatum]|uniref:Uncharacterized protein n=1 Tax=Sesamum radiatum TaxID=300843 RepID=A0AAW2W3Z6_SESRA